MLCRVVARSRVTFVRQQRGRAPDWLPVATPVTIERPPWQRLARIPLALPKMSEAARGVLRHQALIQIDRQTALVGSQCGRIPLRTIRIIDGYERRLAAHGETYVLRLKLGVDFVPQLFDRGPLFLRVGFGHARRFPYAIDLHGVGEFDLGLC